MRICVNGVRLFFDVAGTTLAPHGAEMRQKPTLIVLHGGPGADHSIHRPAFDALSDIAQVIYLDHRGNGRSDDGDPADWTLAQWGDDLRAFCDALEIENPIVFGASFGGFVAQSYATRHPGHARAVILANTSARVDFEQIFTAFGKIGGPQAQATARAYWMAPTPEKRQDYSRDCLPLYSVTPADPHMMARCIVKAPVAMAFNGPDNEMGRFDFRADLATLRCPTLVMSGDRDVMMPPAFSDTIAASAVNAPVTRLRLDNCGHMALTDAPDAMLGAIRQFLAGLA